MYMRESFVKQFFTIENGQPFLSWKNPDIRIIGINGKNINIGLNKIPVHIGDTIIFFSSSEKDFYISISSYEENNLFHEKFKCITSIYNVGEILNDIPEEYVNYVLMGIKECTTNYVEKQLQY